MVGDVVLAGVRFAMGGAAANQVGQPVFVAGVGIPELAPGHGNEGATPGEVEIAVAAVPYVQVIEPKMMRATDGNGICGILAHPGSLDVQIPDDDVALAVTDIDATLDGRVLVRPHQSLVALEF